MSYLHDQLHAHFPLRCQQQLLHVRKEGSKAGADTLDALN